MCLLQKNNVNFLIDTSSSDSLISQNLFNQLKQNLTRKHLGTNVSLTTVNSKVNFSACIQTSIKIKNKSYPHHFYIVDKPSSSEFVDILGFDFINKFYIILDLQKNTIPLINSANFNLNTHSVNCNQVKEISYPISAFTCAKTIIQPQEELMIYIFAETVSDIVIDLFEPKILEGSTMFDSIHNIQNKNACNKKTLKESIFKLHVENSSNKTVHTKKGSNIGEAYEIDDIKIPEASNRNQNQSKTAIVCEPRSSFP